MPRTEILGIFSYRPKNLKTAGRFQLSLLRGISTQQLVQH
jgi:hypothetical protein